MKKIIDKLGGNSRLAETGQHSAEDGSYNYQQFYDDIKELMSQNDSFREEDRQQLEQILSKIKQKAVDQGVTVSD